MSAPVTTWGGKARFQEFLRRVQSGERLLITLHGEPVVELRPFGFTDESIAERLARLEREGRPAAARGAWDFRPLRPALESDCVEICVD